MILFLPHVCDEDCVRLSLGDPPLSWHLLLRHVNTGWWPPEGVPQNIRQVRGERSIGRGVAAFSRPTFTTCSLRLFAALEGSLDFLQSAQHDPVVMLTGLSCTSTHFQGRGPFRKDRSKQHAARVTMALSVMRHLVNRRNMIWSSRCSSCCEGKACRVSPVPVL